MPSVFVRTSGCNLRCAWCDTPYTSWQPEGTDWALDRILDEVRAYPARHVVITGGEPMIQPEIMPLTTRLGHLGLHITIETAGTVFQPGECDLMSISPKLSNSTPEGPWVARHEELRIQQQPLSDLMSRFAYQLKFVIAKPEDMDEVRAFLRAFPGADAHTILMPEGVESAILRERSLWLAEICKQEGFRFSPRLHVDLYGNQRGT